MKSKVINFISINIPVYQCSFNPVDAAVISVIGKDCVKFYRSAEKYIRTYDESPFLNSNFIIQCWLKYNYDQLLAGTESGIIHSFQSGEYNRPLDCSPGSEFPINSLISIPGGFFVGTKKGIILYYQFIETKDREFHKQFILITKLQHDFCNN